MKKSRFSESQIVSILKEGEAGIPVVEVCRKQRCAYACDSALLHKGLGYLTPFEVFKQYNANLESVRSKGVKG